MRESGMANRIPVGKAKVGAGFLDGGAEREAELGGCWLRKKQQVGLGRGVCRARNRGGVSSSSSF